MRKSIIKLCSLAILGGLLFSSCASIVTKTTYHIPINTNPQGAEITIADKKGKIVYQGTTPATASLRASQGYMSGARYEVRLKSPGYKEQVVYIDSSIEGWYWGNIFFGGLIGMLIVDPLSGAMYKLDNYPINIGLAKEEKKGKENIEEETTGLNDDFQGEINELKILSIDDIPDDLKPHLKQIN